MFRDVLVNANLTEWPIAALIIFLICCAGILYWIFRKGSSAHYKEISNLVFEDEDSKSKELHKENKNDTER